MEKTYNPKDIEKSLYEYWEQKGYFKPNNNTRRGSYCIMIPPPNITGSLHVGHAFQQTIMDILIRYHRMQGKNTLWQVGTDHAGIATQILVEQKIATEEYKTRYDYGRTAFIEKIWQWKEQFGEKITNQMRRLGNSIDWENERFTMDKGFSIAVQEVFISLYEENLIYRGKRLVNWDPKLRTAISDLEVENRKSKGIMWYLRYPLADGVRTTSGLNYLIVATTRPETMLGDTGVGVHPKDPRYCDLIGQFVILPLTGRRVQIIGDDHINITKGTGCIKITPAHDFNDYEIGKRHALPMINILTFDGNIRQYGEVFDAFGNVSDIVSGEIPVLFRGLERFTARKAIIAEFDRLGLLVEARDHNIILPYGNRSGVIIEPVLSNQWYLRTASLAKVAIEAVEEEKIQFVPKQYKNMYFSWMRNIQDWCISRQLWWGHRIPAWYNDKGQVYVGHSEKEIRRKHQLGNDTLLQQDEDVLDTWFSSGLWTFSTLGWPKNTKMLRMFHPTNVVVSGFDIIFFWIARMIMLTMHFIKDKNGKPQVPFKTVYITGLIRDEEGQKMSKSRGNIIDPLDIVDGISLSDLIRKRTTDMLQPQLAAKIRKRTEKHFPNGIKPYGIDALRFTLAAVASTSRNINWDMKRLEGYRNFCNKLWNAVRFVLINTKEQDCGFHGGIKILSLADRWILGKFNQTIQKFRKNLDSYRFDLAANILYEFVWNQFCDWYLELIKPIISNSSNDAELRGTRHTLVTVLELLLRLAHPIIPFITEALWKRVKSLTGNTGDTLMLQQFPSYNEKLVDSKAFTDLEWIKQAIIIVRTIRSEMNISPEKPLSILLRQPSPAVVRRIHENLMLFLTLARLENITFLSANDKSPVSIIQNIDGAELLIPMVGLVNKEAELNRLSKEVIRIDEKIKRIVAKLDNKSFIDYAPKVLIAKEREKLESYQQSRVKLIKQKATIADL